MKPDAVDLETVHHMWKARNMTAAQIGEAMGLAVIDVINIMVSNRCDQWPYCSLDGGRCECHMERWSIQNEGNNRVLDDLCE